MATIRFLYRSKRDKAPLKMRLRHLVTYPDGSSKNFQPEIDSGIEVLKSEAASNNYTKEISRKLEDIEEFILNAFNVKQSETFEPTKQWLQNTYNDFNNKKEHSDIHRLVDWIDSYKSYLELNSKSKNRIKAFPSYKQKIIEYDASIEMHELSNNKMEAMYSYLVTDLKHAKSTARRFMRDIMAVGRFAQARGAELGENFHLYKLEKMSKAQKAKETLKPIVLTADEIEAIYNLELNTPYLENVRKWMLLAIYTAQRGEDVMNSIREENFIYKNGKLFIEFTQSKTGEEMSIPALKRVREIYESGSMPHPISLAKFNKYLKEVCKEAKINDEIEHKKIEVVKVKGKKVNRKILGKRSKYEYLASHGFRRTFCTLYYGKKPNVEIMKISGHRTEREFLKYIGKTEKNYDNWKDE